MLVDKEVEDILTILNQRSHNTVQLIKGKRIICLIPYDFAGVSEEFGPRDIILQTKADDQCIWTGTISVDDIESLTREVSVIKIIIKEN